MKKIIFCLGIILVLTGCSNNNYSNGEYKINNDSIAIEDYYEDDNIINIEDYYEDTTYTRAASQKRGDWITVKYRDTQVDISDFLTTNTSDSSFIEKAYYDSDNEYLILKMNGTYYHRCEVPSYVWNSFKNADSKGTYYNKYIKGEYDCRYATIPVY